MSLSSAGCGFRTMVFRKLPNVVTFMTLQCPKVQPKCWPSNLVILSKKTSTYYTSQRYLNLTVSLRMSKNHYDVLGVPRNATPKQIKDAYYQLAMKHHPDKNQGKLSDQFRKIKEAYDVLSNEISRMKYDNDSSNYDRYSSKNYSYTSNRNRESNNWWENSSSSRYGSNNEQYTRTEEQFKYRNPYGKRSDYSQVKTLNLFINVITVPKNVVKTQIDIMLLTFIKNRTLKLILFQLFQFVWTQILNNLNFNILIPTSSSSSSAVGDFVRSILKNKTIRLELSEIDALKGKAVRIQVNNNEKVLIVNLPRGVQNNQSFYLFYLIDEEDNSNNFKI